MTKPWTMGTFPKDQPVYIRNKGNPAGASLVMSLAPFGVNVFTADDKGNIKAQGITWKDLFLTCERLHANGGVVPCGVVVR